MKQYKTIFFTVICILFVSNSFSQVVHVDSNNQSGTSDGSTLQPFTFIEQAVLASAEGDTIKVAQGNYEENILLDNKVIFLLGAYKGGSVNDYVNGIAGDFVTRDYSLYPSTINGQSDNAVIEMRNATSGSIIDGFVIKGGERGIYFDDNYTWPPVELVTISNNIIEENGRDELNDETGGGLRVKGEGILIENNIIRNNKAGRGGGMSAQGDNIVIKNNVFDGNIANSDHGGGLFLYGTFELTDNIVSNNRVGELCGYGWGGGVIFLETGYGLSISENNIYRHNYAPTYGGGVFVDEAAMLWMMHDLVYGNTSDDDYHGGAGIAVDQSGSGIPSFLYMDLCSVAENYSLKGIQGNGIYADVNSFAFITNSIFYNNGGDFHTSGNSKIDLRYSLCEDEVEGEYLIHDDPLFADASNGDFHLKSAGGRYTANGWVLDDVHSPAIDAGDPSSVYTYEPDPNGLRVNLGRYGNTPEASKSGTVFLESHLQTIRIHSRPNPVKKQSEISIDVGGEACTHLVIYSQNGVENRTMQFDVPVLSEIKMISPVEAGTYMVVLFNETKTVGFTKWLVVE